MSKKISKSDAAKALDQARKQSNIGSRKERSGRVLHKPVAVKTALGPVKVFRLGKPEVAKAEK